MFGAGKEGQLYHQLVHLGKKVSNRIFLNILILSSASVLCKEITLIVECIWICA